MSAKNEYGENYIKWKKWSPQTFGFVSLSEIAYFNSEIRRVGMDAGVSQCVLEIGFGNGAFLGYCKKIGWNVVGVEVNPELIGRGMKAGYNVVNYSELSQIENGKFDIVVAFDVLEHLTTQEQIRMLREIRRLLKPGGRLLARFPNGDSPMGLRYQNGDDTHISFISSSRVLNLASNCGYDSARVLAQAVPIFGGGAIRFLFTLIRCVIFIGLDTFMMLVFHPRTRIHYSSMNLVLIAVRNGS